MVKLKEEFTIESHQFASRLGKFANPSYQAEYSVPSSTSDPIVIKNLQIYLAFVEPNPVYGTPDW